MGDVEKVDVGEWGNEGWSYLGYGTQATKGKIRKALPFLLCRLMPVSVRWGKWPRHKNKGCLKTHSGPSCRLISAIFMFHIFPSMSLRVLMRYLQKTKGWWVQLWFVGLRDEPRQLELCHWNDLAASWHMSPSACHTPYITLWPNVTEMA